MFVILAFKGIKTTSFKVSKKKHNMSKYVIYTFPVGDIIRKHGLDYHFYADDSQLHIAFEIADNSSLQSAIGKIINCVNEIDNWMSINKLKLNQDKTEVLVFTSVYNKEPVHLDSISIGNTSVNISTSARNIGVLFDNKLTMSEHINYLCKSASFSLRKIGSIRKFINQKACAQLVHSVVTTKIDYANSLLYGIPDYQFKRIQMILNSAARLVALKSKFEHIAFFK